MSLPGISTKESGLAMRLLCASNVGFKAQDWWINRGPGHLSLFHNPGEVEERNESRDRLRCYFRSCMRVRGGALEISSDFRYIDWPPRGAAFGNTPLPFPFRKREAWAVWLSNWSVRLLLICLCLSRVWARRRLAVRIVCHSLLCQ